MLSGRQNSPIGVVISLFSVVRYHFLTEVQCQNVATQQLDEFIERLQFQSEVGSMKDGGV